MEQTPKQNVNFYNDEGVYQSVESQSDFNHTTAVKLFKNNQVVSVDKLSNNHYESTEKPLREFMDDDDEDERDDRVIEIDTSKFIGGKKANLQQLLNDSDLEKTQNLQLDDNLSIQPLGVTKQFSKYDVNNQFGLPVDINGENVKDICCENHDHGEHGKTFKGTMKFNKKHLLHKSQSVISGTNEPENSEDSDKFDREEEKSEKKNFFVTQVGKIEKFIHKTKMTQKRSHIKRKLTKFNQEDYQKPNTVSTLDYTLSSHKKLVRKKSKWGFIDIDDPNALKEQTTAHRFGKFQHHFKKLALRTKQKTDYDLNSIIIANDESLIISIQMIDHEFELLVTLWDISKRSGEQLDIFNEFSIKAQDHMKAFIASQNQQGTLYCIPYFDSGMYKIRVFDRENEEICQVDDLNEQLGISKEQRGSNTLMWSSIGVKFIDDENLFVSLYDFQEEVAWQFRFNIARKQVEYKQGTSLKGTHPNNFLMSCLYDINNAIYYGIYRFGQCISYNHNCEQSDSLTINNDHGGHSKLQDLEVQYVGQAHLLKCNVLVIRNQNVHFYKREKIENENHKSDFVWQKFHSLNYYGTICNTPGSNDLLVVTQHKIYLYHIDPSSYLPILSSVIFNFIGCTYMVQSLSKETIISYQVGSEDFMVYKRNYHHNFRVAVDYKIHQECIAIDIKKCRAHCISDGLKLTFYSDVDLKQIEEVPQVQVVQGEVQNLEMGYQERILNMKISQQNEEILVVFVGKNQKNGVKKVTAINVYQIKYEEDEGYQDLVSVQLKRSQKMKEEMQKISHEFEFVYEQGTDRVEEIFLIDDAQIYIYNFEEQTLKLILNFSQNFGQSLNGYPNLFVLNSNQDKAFIQTKGGNILLIDLIEKEKYVELEDVFKISHVKACMNANGKFYILANKRQKDKGIFLLALDENDLDVKDQENFSENDNYLIKWSTHLDIGDVDIFCVQDKVRDSFKVHNFKTIFRRKFQERYLKHQYSFDRTIDAKTSEIVISYKTIYKNTYDIIVCDLQNNYKNFIFRHQSFHLWEMPIKGIMLSTQIFLMISTDGIFATSLSRSKHQTNQKFADPLKKQIVRELHSLQECTYLKINPSNYLFFRYSENQNDIEINIQEQYISKRDKQTQFQDIMQIKIQEMTLWDILLFQGIFCCPSQDEMAKLITELPNPQVFFKCLLELDMANMVTLLSFDSRCIKALLRENNIKNIDHKFPIFHKICYWNHHPKENSIELKEGNECIIIENAIDIALANNQIMALNQIIGYMVKYQNNFVHSYLFERNFLRLIEKNIFIKDLLNSDIFCHQFDFDDNEWPQIHTNDEKMIMHYNGEIFDIRRQYSKVFKDLYSTHDEEMKAREDPDSTFYKIKYTLNLLPYMDKESFDGNLMDLFGETEQIEVFQTKVVRNLINFKWQKYGRVVHQTAAMVHMVYVVTFLVYLERQYLNRNEEFHLTQMVIMTVCNTFAMAYDTRQMIKQGRLYLYDTWNYFDQLYIWSGYLNLLLQYDFWEEHNHFEPFTQSVMIFFTCMMLTKTFFFLRIFKQFTKLVIMIRNVIRDLQEFLIFYILLIIMFSVILGVLGFGNFQNSTNKALLDMIDSENKGKSIDGYPGYEYKNINQFLVNAIIILRFSLGDFDFAAVSQLNDFERAVFWIAWTFIVLTTCVIFLNFIIAEVSNSYDTVNTNVQELILQERAKMIMESEDMMNQSVKENKVLFPKYLIIREVEE